LAFSFLFISSSRSAVFSLFAAILAAFDGA
jgi:hypothetical protein